MLLRPSSRLFSLFLSSALNQVTTITGIHGMRHYSMSVRRYESPNSVMWQSRERTSEKETDDTIDDEMDEHIFSDWDTLPDEDELVASLRMTIDRSAKQGQTKHVYAPGDIGILYTSQLGWKERPVVVLSSLKHNSSSYARLLVVPLSTKAPNTCLYQWKLFPSDTVSQMGLAKESIILFDHSAMVRSSTIQQTRQALKRTVFVEAKKWWRFCIDSILADPDV